MSSLASYGSSRSVLVSEEDEDDELFEIDLKVVDNIPPPLYLEGYFTRTSSALLANCLLPLAVISSAVPADSFGGKGIEEVSRVVMMFEIKPTVQ
ncbi:hypothetical protein Syun_016540 [Stephania yunnanensis]|uniref:Uncharacterized protein n=1 Tax=Stephania yunnanensis TaxID=152371 RepID=A0AAP0J7J3_9MAGN